MANFPPYQYQPMMGYQQMYYQQPQVQQQEQPLYCRAVTSREEALGVPTDFSGRPMTFIDPAHGRVWVKTFNPATGSADLDEYCKATAMPKDESPSFASVAALQALEKKVEELTEELGKVRRRRTQHEREAVDDEV